ncbi:outer membrane protein assembly factor BamB family protein [Micromonospora sp. NBC_01739]|uniref:outer membrane protein assembly factor BamB family protein n=1 Tax=Micromonospora sp. NBC_01739 TaxID=2975985 RepID=UPI002E1295EA|nr:PQQ-like beta-propeller repeat protein [Micromonospora sp. NBC_01739]
MTVIDLGDRTERINPRRRHRIVPSRWLLVPVALVVLLALTSAVPPARRMQAILPSSLAAEVILPGGGQILAVAPATGSAEGGQELLAYQPPARATGSLQQLTPLWRRALGVVEPVRVERVNDSTLVISVFDSAEGAQSLLLDSRTGELRWRRPGMVVLVEPDRVILRSHDSQGLDQLTTLEVASGRELWSVPSARAVWPLYHLAAPVIDVVAVAKVSGEIEVLDARTGALRGRLPAAPDDPANPVSHRYPMVAGDLLLAWNPSAVTAYDLDGLVRRWHIEVPSLEWIYQCGALLCAPSGRSRVHLLDPVAGAVRWTVEDDVEVLRAGDRRALAADHHRQGNLSVVTFDAETGQRATAEGSWDLVQDFGNAPHLLGTRAVPEVGAVLARLDPETGQPRRIDLLPGAVGNCRYRDDLILCRRRDGNFGLWQLPD